MEENKNLAELSKEISNELLDSIRLFDVLVELIDDAKESTLLELLKKKNRVSFDKIEQCRQMICIDD